MAAMSGARRTARGASGARAPFTAMEVATVLAVLAIIVAVLLPLAMRSHGRARKASYNFSLSETTNDPTLVGLYTFDERHGVLSANLAAPVPPSDYRGYGSYGILRQQPAWTTGRWPDTGALYFDGLAAGVDLGPFDVAPAEDNNGLTLVTWFKVRGLLRPASALVSHGGPNGTLWELAITDHARLHVTARTTSGVVQILDVAETPVDTWEAAAITYDGHILCLYRNGQLVSSTPLTGALARDPASSLWFGNRPPAPVHEGFWGVLDEVAIFNRALTASEIARAYEQGRP